MRRRLIVAGAITCLLGVGTVRAESCAESSWDLSAEQSLFAGTSRAVAAAKSAPASGAASTAAIVVDRLYDTALRPTQDIAFAATPGKIKPVEGETYAGLLFFKVASTGIYRVAVDLPLWIDVVDAGILVAVKDFQGLRNCAAPHKVLEYEFVAGRPYVLQLSGAGQRTVHLTLTRSPRHRSG